MGNVQNHCWRKWPSAFRAVSSPRAARELNNAWMTLKIVVRRTNMVCKPLHVKVFNLVLYWARNRVLWEVYNPTKNILLTREAKWARTQYIMTIYWQLQCFLVKMITLFTIPCSVLLLFHKSVLGGQYTRTYQKVEDFWEYFSYENK